MSTYLLTWNPEQWPFTNLVDASNQTRSGEPYREDWSCGNTRRITRGDRVFLLKQGRQQPRGIMAAGWVLSDEVYVRPHWRPERAERGETVLSVEVEFERILNPNTEALLAVKDIDSGPLATVHWDTPASGIHIAEDASRELEDLWAKHVQGLGAPQLPLVTQRNPPWQRDELILALDLYFRFPPSGISQDHAEIIRLSEILNALPIHATQQGAPTFRNPNGVYMKLCNFLRFDPDYQGTGLTRGSLLEGEVWSEFAEHRDELARIAQTIRSTYAEAEMIAGPEEEDEELFPEGRILYRLHRSRERNRTLVKRAKLRARERDGKLACAACKFDFMAFYGSLGEDFIECHHTLPLSELEATSSTRIDDVALLCSNCHRMIHRRRPWLMVHELTLLVGGRIRMKPEEEI